MGLISGLSISSFYRLRRLGGEVGARSPRAPSKGEPPFAILLLLALMIYEWISVIGNLLLIAERGAICCYYLSQQLNGAYTFENESLQFLPDNPGSLNQGTELAEGDFLWQVFHAAIRCQNQSFWLYIL